MSSIVWKGRTSPKSINLAMPGEAADEEDEEEEEGNEEEAAGNTMMLSKQQSMNTYMLSFMHNEEMIKQ
jgi:hypothetical protein